jgi:hypothetical protein
MNRFLLLGFVLVSYVNSLDSQVPGLYINEILASNSKSDFDIITSDYPDWIELYNSTPSSIDIGNYYFICGKSNPEKWHIPVNTILPANSYISYWADNSKVTNHADFELNSDGDFIGLYTPLGVVVDSFSFTGQQKDVSFGRVNDNLSQLVFFPVPTKGAKNSPTFYASKSADPVFSKKGGFYTGIQSIVLSNSSPSSQIRYTTNGSEPDNSSLLYSGPISITKTTALRAKTFETGLLPSKIITRTFFIDEEINLPVISIVTDSDNFFDDYKGIYITGKNGIRGSCDATLRNLNQDWERPVNIELYEKDGSLGINQEAGIKIYGGCSRTRFPQKSLALYARKEYGKGSFDYQLFPDKSIFQFKSFVLRSSADDQVNTFMRDALAQYVSIGEMDVDIQAYRPAVVFFDGEYWGIHDIREKISEHYFESNYNLDKSTVNILEGNGSVSYGKSSDYTNMLNYISTYSLSYPESYEYIKTQMDIDEFIDYEILHIYLGENDWPGNNIKFWNSGTWGHQKWRWICYDLDQTFIYTNVDALAKATATNGGTWPNPPWSTFLLRNLLTNSDFRNCFVQRYAFYLSTTFKPVNLNIIVQKFKSALEPEIPRHVTRWGGKLDPDFHESWTISPTFSSLDEWLQNVDYLIAFVNNRPSYAITQLKSKFGLSGMAALTISTNLPGAGSVMIYDRKVPEPEFSGDFFKGVPIKTRALSNPGYKFLCWEYIGETNKIDSASEITFTIGSNQKITAVYERITGQEPYVIIDEINYHSSPDFNTSDWIEIHNKQNDPIDLSGWKLKDIDDRNVFRFPTGTKISPNGYVTICEDLDSFHHLFPWTINCIGNTGFDLNNDGGVVRLYNAGDLLIDSVRYDDMNPWPELADGEGYSLILKSPELNNDLAENWTAYLHGTPGRGNIEVTGISKSYDYTASQHDLKQNFPNPCSSATTIPYSIASKGNVSIKVYDLSGREVLTLVNEYQVPDFYIVSFNVEPLKVGIYFYTLKVNNSFVGTKKIVVMH